MNIFGESSIWGSGDNRDFISGNEWGTPDENSSLGAGSNGFMSTTLESGLNNLGITGGLGTSQDVDEVLEQSVWGDSNADNHEQAGSDNSALVGNQPSSNGATIGHRREVGITDTNLFSPYNFNQDQDQGTESQRKQVQGGSISGDDESSEDLNDWLESVRKTYHPLDPDTVVIEEIPEREGLLFKHTNYLVKNLVDLPNTEPSKDRSVIRRYSDFVWLQEVLLKRYPFRLIPELPPKRIGSQNADPQFLERRRKGLVRFINLVIKHPVLNKDDLILTFLTVPTDLSSWRKQASYDTTDEFTDKKISSGFIKMWQKKLSEQWNEADASIDKSIEIWLKITFLLERHERRIKQIAHERNIMRSLLNDFTQTTPKLYPVEHSSTILDITNQFNVIGKHLQTTTEYNEQEVDASSTSLVPKFKIFVDVLFSLKGLFERYRIMAGNNVPQLQRRVEINSEKLQTMKGKPDVSGAEYDKIRTAIQRDKKCIVLELNRAWLIRQCILEEFTIFQETQFIITRAFQAWSKLNASFAGLKLNEWEKLTDNLMDLPLSFQ
ncbi:hypothetical protein ZYGR_0AI03050 [Zygosaccharomyces rouxii]|uniref:Sorting nexin MVP1 n=1 Tax=Zygosaccharomyces rouxii TaxID=4956 RepID=A0A1Q3ABV7_ZYGRO|nr:hypothetical protein ZYGR_0AI03050 [Zygosaccharomyces rouxii]